MRTEGQRGDFYLLSQELILLHVHLKDFIDVPAREQSLGWESPQ